MSEYESLRHIGNWVSDLAALSSIGAGIAAIVLTLLPGRRSDSGAKSKEKDASAFIDTGAGETERYRLAYIDLNARRESEGEPHKDTDLASPASLAKTFMTEETAQARTAHDLARTMFDQGGK
ncbi:MAG: hypothetical protein IAF58_22805 [Leptolyngbya sp.]|nr:hypothetical protein [Candidatus Melainabacteria bacterium]